MMRGSLIGGLGMLPLLRLLQDGRFHSGEALGAVLGISRAAVWKQLQALESELAIPIHKIRGRGYRLERPLQLLDEALIAAAQVPDAWPLSVLPVVDSTNAEALRALQGGRLPPFVLLAERQVAGRGRRGRVWVSPFAENLYYSLVLKIEGGVHRLDGMSLVVGLALLSALRAMGLHDAGLKWPNDVLVGRRKLAGILLELSGDPGDVCHLVIGIGVNVNMQPGLEEIDQPYTSMCAELGRTVDRNDLVVQLNAQLARYLAIHRDSGFAALREEWEGSHLWQGREVSLSAGAGGVEGVVLGVDDSGAIRLEVAGAEQCFSGGELSLRLRNDS